MCNNIHKETIPCEVPLYGYKVFSKACQLPALFTNSGELSKLLSFIFATPYNRQEDNSIVWNSSYEGDGFCFFFTLSETRRMLLAWGKEPSLVIKKIKIEGFLCKQKEDGILYEEQYFTVGLCKSFSIINEENHEEYSLT